MRFKEETGAASLETLIVLIPWLAIIFVFLNLVFMIGSIMINQTVTNRGAQQIAATGCVPSSLKADLEEAVGIGVRNPSVRAIAPRTVNRKPTTQWNRNLYLNDDGGLRSNVGGYAIEVPPCPVNGELPSSQIIPSGNFIFVQISYQQLLPGLSLASTLNGDIPEWVTVRRNALVVSQSLEGEG